MLAIEKTKNEDHWMKSDNLILLKDNFTINSNENQLQTTTMETENTTILSDTTHSIFCNSNEIPFIPNSMTIPIELNMTYNVGTILFFICQPGYESSSNKSSFTTCSINRTWSIDTINKTMCQLSKWVH